MRILAPDTARPEDRCIRLLLPVLYMPPGSEVASRALREEGEFLLFTGSGISKLRVVPLRVATSEFPYPGCHLQISSVQLTGLEGERDSLEDNMEANYVDSLAKEIAALLHGWDPTELLAAEDASELLPVLAAMKIRALGCLRTADRAVMGMAQHQVGAKGLHPQLRWSSSWIPRRRRNRVARASPGPTPRRELNLAPPSKFWVVFSFGRNISWATHP